MTSKINARAAKSVPLANFLNSGAIVTGSTGLALWTKSLNLSSLQVGALGACSANAFGAAFGALIGGWIADRWGRQMIFRYDMLVYLLGTILIICAPNFFLLLTGFIVTGLAVGGGIPTTWTYAGESTDSHGRAHSVGITQFAWTIGPAIIYAIGGMVAPLGLIGTRILFSLLSIVAIITWQLQCQLAKITPPASGHQDAHPYRALFTNPTNLKSLLFLLGVYLFWNLVAGAMGFFMPYVYVQAGGLTNLQANALQMVLWACTGLGTYFFFAKLGDRYPYRRLFACGALGEIVAWVILTYGGMNWTCLILFILIYGLAAGLGAQQWYSLWTTELFPAKYRASAQGLSFFIVYGCSGIWSLFFPSLLKIGGLKVLGTVLILFLVISLVVGVIWTPHTQGKSLQEIIKERY